MSVVEPTLRCWDCGGFFPVSRTVRREVRGWPWVERADLCRACAARHDRRRRAAGLCALVVLAVFVAAVALAVVYVRALLR